MRRADIRRKFDSIVDFAQIPRAIDTQVKYYSSGMQLRLGFSIAAHLEPDVLVVDEALSVGDAAFQSRAVHRIRQLIGGGTTVVLVSHDLWAIEALCDRAALIDEGQLLDVGTSRDVVAHYLSRAEETRTALTGSGANDGRVRFAGASLHDAEGAERTSFATGEPAEIRVRFNSEPGITRPHVVVVLADIECSMLDDGAIGPEVAPDRWECRLRLGSLPLRPRLYEIWCTVLADDGYGRLMDWMQVGTLRVAGELGGGKTAVANAHMTGSTLVAHEWDVREVAGGPAE
jgi:energy-coupling factor transporter ATP-binding protein EcfA2